MKTRAAVAVAAAKPLEVTEVDLEGPRDGEVLIEVKATGICHTDDFTLSGADPEGLFPAILGHEGAGVVVEIGRGVTSVRKGDHVIPLYTPECRQCLSCLSRKTNLCTAIRATQGQGVMPDGSSRFSKGEEKIFHYMGCSTFSNFTVLPEIALAKVNPDAPFDKICYIGCGVTTGIGAVLNTAKVEAGATAVVFGLGGIGLNVIQGLRLAGADMIIGVDLNNDRKAWGERFGMTHFVNPNEVGKELVPHLVNMTKRGADQIGGADYRHRLWRGARAHRCAEDCRVVHGRQDRDRPDDYAYAQARRHQQGIRADAQGRKHSKRGGVLGQTQDSRRRRRGPARRHARTRVNPKSARPDSPWADARRRRASAHRSRTVCQARRRRRADTRPDRRSPLAA
jgi:S-(hydroxymethyl)glutathione dehydrogenase / alcohol dehydrogenase